MKDIRSIENEIRKEASSVLGSVILFIAYYFMLIMLGMGLFVGAFWVTWRLFLFMTEAESVDIRLLALGIIACLAMWWFCIQIGWYLIKPLFKTGNILNNSLREVVRDECPELFKMIEDVANNTGNKMPKHVYLSADLNASVCYNSTSIWSIFLPSKKNLILGTGLLQGLNQNEIKSILGHEFGHFSQNTMKVGQLTYKLLLIIHDMMNIAKEQHQRAIESRLENEEGSIAGWFHIAYIPMNFITKQTIKFYNYIERKNRRLSRCMEFEADVVACKVVGAKSFISSLCKLEVLSDRFQIFENVVVKLLRDERYLSNYAKGFDLVDRLIGEDEGIIISFDKTLESLVNEKAKFSSKVTIIDGWNTHPSTTERIGNASQFITEKNDYKSDSSRELVNTSILSEVGAKRQNYICDNLDPSIYWKGLKEMDMDEFEEWVGKQFDNHHIPALLKPFVDRRIAHFDMPNDEMLSKPIDTPFTEENRKLVLQYEVAVEDLDTLYGLSADKVKQFLYNGSETTDINQALMEHKKYLGAFEPELSELDKNIFIYLCQKSENSDDIKRLYWMLLYSSSAIDGMEEMPSVINSIKEQAQIYYENGVPFQLNENVRTTLAQKFWNFLHKLDYDSINANCGNWTYDDHETVSQQLNTWIDFASNNDYMNIRSDELITMIETVYGLLAHIYQTGKDEWISRLINIEGKRAKVKASL